MHLPPLRAADELRRLRLDEADGVADDAAPDLDSFLGPHDSGAPTAQHCSDAWAAA